MKISFIGAGNMATAIIKSVIKSGRMNASEIFVYDKFDEKASTLAQIGANKCESLSDACNFADVILLAVKPQDYPELLENIRNCTENLEKKTFISIAAAISCAYICSVLGCNCPVVRVMPNTPLLIGEGATAISRNEHVGDKLYSKICTLFAASGCVCSLDEDMMNKVISVNSSSPVYVYMLAKAMTDKAVEYGFSEKNARELVLQTIKGSVDMMLKTGKTPDELISMVASPGGTTLASIKSFETNGFDDTVKSAMDSCTARADELAK